MRQPSSRTRIAPFLAMEMAREADRLAASGRALARFDVGQPFAGASPRALEAVNARFATASLGYTEGLGAPALRAAIAKLYERRYGLALDPARVVVTAGASGAFVLAFLALFEAGDRVALAAPGYPPYRHILTALGYRPAIATAEASDAYQLTPEHVCALAREGPLAGALIASPANPTGAMLSQARLSELALALREEGAALISDEIYHGLTYGAPAACALAADDEAFIVNSFSKYWAMTGWRVGWLITPTRFTGALERLSQNLFISASAPAQAAALAALDDEGHCESLRSVYAANRALLMDALPAMGLAPITAPDGAFYILADVSQHGARSEAFALEALHQAGVALTTGEDFDPERGGSWIRIAYARSTAEAEMGIARLRHWLERR